MMRLIIDYKIIKLSSESKLELKVVECIKEGWQPLGGICASTKESSIMNTGIFIQAMVKYR